MTDPQCFQKKYKADIVVDAGKRLLLAVSPHEWPVKDTTALTIARTSGESPLHIEQSLSKCRRLRLHNLASRDQSSAQLAPAVRIRPTLALGQARCVLVQGESQYLIRFL